MAWGSQSLADRGAQFPDLTAGERLLSAGAGGGRARGAGRGGPGPGPRAQAHELPQSWRAGQVFPVSPG